MQPETNLTPVEREIENALRSLRPASSAAPATQLAFELGRASMAHKLRTWRISTAMLGCSLAPALFLGAQLAPHAAPAPHTTSLVAQPAPVPAPSVTPHRLAAGNPVSAYPIITPIRLNGPFAAPDYAALRSAVISKGIDGLQISERRETSRNAAADSFEGDRFRSPALKAPQRTHQSSLNFFLQLLTSGDRS